MTEQELLKEVCNLCDDRNLTYCHFPDSRKLVGTAGLPDLIIVGKHRLLWVELKATYGDMSSTQVRWKWALLAVGQSWQLWRPNDLTGGYIEKTLDEL